MQISHPVPSQSGLNWRKITITHPPKGRRGEILISKYFLGQFLCRDRNFPVLKDKYWLQFKHMKKMNWKRLRHICQQRAMKLCSHCNDPKGTFPHINPIWPFHSTRNFPMFLLGVGTGSVQKVAAATTTAAFLETSSLSRGRKLKGILCNILNRVEWNNGDHGWKLFRNVILQTREVFPAACAWYNGLKSPMQQWEVLFPVLYSWSAHPCD